ncbi:phosphatase PAP2 family protein [Paenibacillus filicis]|uniref:Phosphatase PAP2 family protein n=1 Tax=Paenibacillus gyeongsangnamensis TaxID=3388067 RepID=A0ABT4QHP2_9BACL|nr:phosphatase PAP2 family protein [Paenibacillus filicis]MCZ8516343.1 phosphatase PAP2 family protein [Paenibacillus filicis]
MNLIKQLLTGALLIGIGCAVGFFIIALLISDKRIDAFDAGIISAVGKLESPGLTKVMIFFTTIGAGWPAVLITAGMMMGLYVWVRQRRELILLAAVAVGSAALNTVLKLLFRRARPTLHRIVEATGYSFPSGHSMAAFTLYGLMVFLLWKHIPSAAGRVAMIILGTFMIFMIGLSRIYLGVHYPSDVLGGFLASGCWLTVSIWFYQRYQDRHAR